MMEPLNSSSLGAMGSVLKKLDDLRTGDEQAHGLIVNLGTISTKLKNLSEVHDPPLTVKYWMTDARELSYDMEVCLDQFVHASQQGAMSAEVASIKEVLGRFTVRVEEVMERFERYNLVNRFVPPNVDARLFSCKCCEKNDGNSPRNDISTDLSQNPLASVRPTEDVLSHNLQNLYMEAEPLDPIGMEDPSKLLDEWLKLKGHGEGDLGLKVVSVLGDGGVGKSTLVKRLWRASEGKFECRAFVQMSKKPDMMMVLISILSQVCRKQPSESFDVRNLIEDLKKHLQNKRYFIIIDDLWDVSGWHIIGRAFPKGNYSIVIITTAVENIAQECCSYGRNNIVNVKRLQENQPKKLFVDTAFGSAEGYSLQFNDVIDKIARKCGGLPLAITCTARFVGRSQAETEKKQLLDYVNTFLHDNLRTHSSSKDILNQVLKLCYSSLPHCLKTCLLYLSVYPENYSFLKEDLVKQWIAEDFICTQEKKESVALRYFEQLLNLGLIQRMDFINSERKRLLSYTVHPVVFDFITCESMEDNFVRVIDYSQSKMVLSEKIRRLSLHFGGATYATIPAGLGLSQVRTLGFMGLLGCLPSLEKFELVRVLILHLWGDHGKKRFSLIDICKLRLLRYLQVRCNVIVELPGEVQCLKHLETLEINADVAGVPPDTVHHSSLQHVRIGRKTKHKNLSQGPVTSTKSIFSEDLGNKPSPAVQVLELLPPICSFSRLPGWISDLTGLRILEVVVGELGTYGLYHLGKLPLLTVLSLYVQKPATQRTTFHTSTSPPFAALEYFKFLSGAMLLNFPAKGMAKLPRLKIRFNARRGEKYNDMLRGLHYLENLKEMAACMTANTDEESDLRKAAESAFEQAIKEVQGLRSSGQIISVNVKWLDKVDKGYDPPESSDKSQIPSPSNDIAETADVLKQAIEAVVMIGNVMVKHKGNNKDIGDICDFVSSLRDDLESLQRQDALIMQHPSVGAAMKHLKDALVSTKREVEDCKNTAAVIQLFAANDIARKLDRLRRELFEKMLAAVVVTNTSVRSVVQDVNQKMDQSLNMQHNLDQKADMKCDTLHALLLFILQKLGATTADEDAATNEKRAVGENKAAGGASTGLTNHRWSVLDVVRELNEKEASEMSLGGQKIVIKVDIVDKRCMSEILAIVSMFKGIKSMKIDPEKGMLVVVGTVNMVPIMHRLRKKGITASIVSVEDAKPKEKDCCKEMGRSKDKDKCDKESNARLGGSCSCSRCKQSSAPGYFYGNPLYAHYEDKESLPDRCTIQ